MAARSPVSFQRDVRLHVATDDDLDVRRIEVVESMMAPFEVHIEALSANVDVDLAAIVGQEASIELDLTRGPAATRTWAGICRHAEHRRVGEDGLSTYQLILVPMIWALDERRDHRIFQTMSELDIALAILGEWGIEPDVRARMSDYPDRKYRVQYGESDLAFVTRLLEDAGISYHHETEGGATTLVLDDAAHTRSVREAAIPYVVDPQGDLREDYATDVRVCHRPAPAAYTQRDVDYRRAADFPLLASAQREVRGPLARAERFHYVPGAFVFRAAEISATPNADDRGVHRADLALGQRQVERRFDAKRSKARRVYFETTAFDLRPGVLFRFRDHPKKELGADTSLLVVATRFTWEFPSQRRLSVEARFTDVPYRPPVATPRPRATGVETATVVGPPGEEIHTDEYGRVRVHFHWDRRGGRDDKDSCWLPVSQNWGGAGYGSVNLPRIGQEVLVDFLGGDVDRPIVTGRVYTSLQKVPWELPANKTQTGLKSASSPATGGYNEIMFEDAAGKELMRIQAEKDRSTLVKNDCDSTVQRNRATAVGNDEAKLVARDQLSAIRRNRMVSVEGNSEHLISANDVAVVGGDRAELTAGRRRADTGHSYLSKVGNASSFFVQTEGFIIIQAPKVFINPGLTEAQIQAAVDTGIPPKTADEIAQEQAAAAAARQGELQGALDSLRGRTGDTHFSDPNYPPRAAYERAELATDPVDRAYHSLAGDVMARPRAFEQIGEGHLMDELQRGMYGGDPLTSDQATAVVDRLISQGYP